jgi:DNA polymerase III epsilon subunit-like protein
MSLRITFSDTETTGLGRDRPAAVIQYCLAVWCDGDVSRIESRYILPPEEIEPEPGAVKVNGYSRERWIELGATPFNEQDADLIRGMCDGAVMGGANVAFDKGFLAKEFERLGQKPPNWSHRDADISKMAYGLVAAGIIPSASLQAVSAHFGHSVQSGLHGAEEDVEAAIACFEGLVDETVLMPLRYKAALEKIAEFSRDSQPGVWAREALGLP